ncbi:MAG: hypothetical protein QOF51_2900 [Chloroflexota bacterium]|nr:hypothetical protein [Chloroflexota bacterium]
MQLIDGELVCSASDLTGYLACPHLTQLDLDALLGKLARPTERGAGFEVVSKRGLIHEQRYLERLRAEGRQIVEIARPTYGLAAIREAHLQTVAALHSGAEVVYQGALFDGRWLGYADFLVRVEEPSHLGPFSYEVVDTKLARHVKAEALLQMCAYAEQLARIQGVEPRRIRVVLGDLTEESHRLRDYAAYYRSVKARFEVEVLGESPPTYPTPVEHCAICDWAPHCAAQRHADDHLSLVANIRGDQVRKLETAGIPTVTALADADPGDRPAGVARGTFERLQKQASVQIRGRTRGEVVCELLEHAEPRRGLAALPMPTSGDLFFDMEGDPFVEDGGLEYLFGVVELTDNAPRYHAFWAHDRSDERRAFETFVDFVMERLAHDPALHIFHYAPYEPTALKRLMGTHATREIEIDRLLRGNVLVDLYQIVRQSIVVSQESYSIKQLEPLYMEARHGAIKDAGSSVVAYEQWLDNEDPALLDEIAAYNRDDCVSTWLLRDWLEARRAELEVQQGAPVPRPDSPDAAPSENVLAVEAAASALVSALTADVPSNPHERDPEQQARWLLAQLVGWHRREDKPEWWAYFARCAMDDAQLIEDTEAIGGLEYVGFVRQEAKSAVHRYRFDPEQEYKLGRGQSPIDPTTGKGAGEIVGLDPARGVLELKRGPNQPAAESLRALIPTGPINTDVQQRAVASLARWVSDYGIDGVGPSRAARDLLLRRPPRITDHVDGEPLARNGELPIDAARRLTLQLDESYLAIQGPPGAGKTYAGAHMIVDLVATGRQVGICGPSHRAIVNLLDAACAYATSEGVALRALQKAKPGEASRRPEVKAIDDNKMLEREWSSGAYQLVAGTSWLFAREALAGAVDTLFIDEAGQLSLANVVAIAGAARNLVLLGDPQQLAQPSQGTHPPGAEASALGHLLHGAATIPPTHGLLLDVTWRLHPSICDFVSDTSYEGLLCAEGSCARQNLGDGEPVGGSGLRFIEVAHAGNRARSDEEAQCIAEAVEGLIGRSWTDQRGVIRPLELTDVLSIAPYNAQVARLTGALPEGASVGTVDKFQGQEAAVVFFSLTTSSADELPHGLDFLFSLNRLNVAISRARALAVLVGNPALFQIRCRTPQQMRMLNAFCRFRELATTPDGALVEVG